MARLLCTVAAATVTARALHVRDVEPPVSQLMDTKVVSALDPELTNTAGETFHVTTPGEWNLIGLPKDYDTTAPETAVLVIDATLVDPETKPCEDLLIKKVTIKGKSLGPSITSLVFSVESDVFNDTAALGLAVGTPSGTSSYDPSAFVALVPQCSITRPRANVTVPTKNSFRKRTKVFSAICTLTSGSGAGVLTNVVTMYWSTVWRGVDWSNNDKPSYMNDLEVYVSGVGTDPAGLLGKDDHSAATKMRAGCPKKQPVIGPYQTRRSEEVKRR